MVFKDRKEHHVMMSQKQLALAQLDQKKEALFSLSDALWDHPETGFHEAFAAESYCKAWLRRAFW